MSLTTTARAALFRQHLPKLTSTRLFTTSGSVRMAEGDTGATRSGGVASSDAFNKREQADETYYVRQREREKLEQLKKKIADSEAELAQHRKEVEDLQKKG